MNMDVRHHRSGRASRSRSFRDAGLGRAIRPEMLLIAVAAVGMLLVEVWQSSRVTELCLSLESSRAALQHMQARLDVSHARLERQTTRAELVPLASQLGLAPADARQVVQLPSEYLADAADAPTESRAPGALAWAERAARALVPDATAHPRDRNPAEIVR
jgi:hypothetical protein